MKTPKIIVIAHNIRSTHNVGSIFRTCDGLGVEELYLTGYTPYPTTKNDERLPHIAEKLSKQINKTALEAEKNVPFTFSEDVEEAIQYLRNKGYVIAGLEQSQQSILLQKYSPPHKIALLLGEEVSGIPKDLIAKCDVLLEIPMQGIKESFNVSVAAGIALYALTI